MCVDRPQALVGRAVVVRGDVRALVVVPVGRPGPRVVLLRRRLLLRSSVVTNSSVAEPRFSTGSSWLRTYRPIATARTITTSPPPSSRRRRVTARRMAERSVASAGRQHAPDALCHYRQLETEGRFLELPRPLRGSYPQHDPASETHGQEGRLAGVAARGGDPTAATGRLRDASKTVNSPMKLDSPSNSPSPSSNTVSGAFPVRSNSVCSPKAFTLRGLEGLLAVSPRRSIVRLNESAPNIATRPPSAA